MYLIFANYLLYTNILVQLKASDLSKSSFKLNKLTGII